MWASGQFLTNIWSFPWSWLANALLVRALVCDIIFFFCERLMNFISSTENGFEKERCSANSSCTVCCSCCRKAAWEELNQLPVRKSESRTFWIHVKSHFSINTPLKLLLWSPLDWKNLLWYKYRYCYYYYSISIIGRDYRKWMFPNLNYLSTCDRRLYKCIWLIIIIPFCYPGHVTL